MIARAASTLSFLGQLAPHPDILAREVVEALRRLAPSVRCSIRVVDGTSSSSEDVRFTVGQIASKKYELAFDESSATLGDSEVLRAIRTVVRGAVAAEQAFEAAMHSVLGSDVEEASEEGAVGIYASEPTKRLLQLAKQLAQTDFPILILGETGTGKEVLAAEIHAFSRRAHRPFIPFNVTAVSRDLLESQLFGARRGSFTGAVSDVKGLIREAEGGTVFLDEIGEMSLELQPKLLRFVEQHEVQPVGDRPQRVDVRVIAATNASLRDLVKEGRFREDLFYRLNVVPLEIPPLRDRREEIPAFVRHFVAAHARDANKPVPDVSPRALERLVAANWPGNVRQLSNELKRIVALLPENESIELRHLSPDVLTPPATPPLAPAGPLARTSVSLDRHLDQVVDDVERAAIERAMFLAHGNISEAARRLGVTRKGLYLKRRRLGLEPAQ
jgi:hydrogenase-4 transcriptional activator